jgi:hypothetical protein
VLLTLAREARTRGWWQSYSSDAIPEWFQVYLGLESEAATIRAARGLSGWDGRAFVAPIDFGKLPKCACQHGQDSGIQRVSQTVG